MARQTGKRTSRQTRYVSEEEEEVEEVEEQEITQRSRAEKIQDESSDDSEDNDNEEGEPSASRASGSTSVAAAAQSGRRQKAPGAGAGKRKSRQNGRTNPGRTDSSIRGQASREQEQEQLTVTPAFNNPNQFDIDNFPDQPLKWPDDKERITQIANDWEQIRGKLELESTQLVVDVAVAMAEAAEGQNGREVCVCTQTNALFFFLGP